MRVFKHYIPLNLLSLGIVEAIIVFASVYAIQTLTLFGFNSLLIGFEPIYPKALTIVFVTMTVFYVANLYDLSLSRRKIEFLSKITLCYVFIAFIFAIISFIYYKIYVNRKIYIVSFIVSLLIIILFRLLYYRLINIIGFREKILIIGTTEITRKISQELESGNNPGYEVLGYIAEEKPNILESPSGCKVLGGIDDLQRITHETHPDAVVVALSERRGAFPAQEILNCKLQGVRVEDWPSFYEKLTGKILTQNLRPSWLIFADGFERNRLTRIVKRAIDMVFAVFGLCVSLPLMACLAMLTRLDSAGPIIFRQERVGENGKIYTLCKFRTMVADAEDQSGPVWSQTIDPRVTRLGKILRRTGMDELPQLLNVLKGDMSFVGPRPERPHFVSELQKQIPYYTQRLVVKPGITGWAQVRYGYGATVEDADEKLQYDLYYIKNMSIFLDLLIMLSTIHKVLFAKVAVQTGSEATPEEPTSQLDDASSDRMTVTGQGSAAVASRCPQRAVAEFSRVEGKF